MSGKWYFYKHDKNLSCSKVVPVLILLWPSLSLPPSLSVCTISKFPIDAVSTLSSHSPRFESWTNFIYNLGCAINSKCIKTKQPDLNLEICPKHLIKIFAISFYITITSILKVQVIAFVLKLIFIICWMSFMHIKFGRK
jgi:hypothetical protein